MRAIRRGCRGQASVELVGFLPLLAAVALGVGQLLAAGVTRELAGQAAQAGAMALVQGDGDARRAAREALPDWSRGRAAVAVRGRRVVVRVRPPSLVPGAARLLEAERVADAGPAPEATVMRLTGSGPVKRITVVRRAAG